MHFVSSQNWEANYDYRWTSWYGPLLRPYGWIKIAWPWPRVHDPAWAWAWGGRDVNTWSFCLWWTLLARISCIQIPGKQWAKHSSLSISFLFLRESWARNQDPSCCFLPQGWPKLLHANEANPIILNITSNKSRASALFPASSGKSA
jgi:hypothetical protein